MRKSCWLFLCSCKLDSTWHTTRMGLLTHQVKLALIRRRNIKACKVERQVCDVRVFLSLVLRETESSYPLRNSEGIIRFIDLSYSVSCSAPRSTLTWRHSNRRRRWERVCPNPQTRLISSMLVSLVERIRYCFCKSQEERWTSDK